MPRGRFFGHREVVPDPRFRDKLVGKFINVLMSRGKKSTAERVCYGAFELIHQRTGSDPLKVFRAAIDNVRPVVEVKSRRVGGASYQVPVEIRPVRRMSLALRWMLEVTSGGLEPAGEPAWPLVQKFFDYLEANAETFWEVPELNLAEPEEVEEDDTFAAAYEGVTFKDSATDGKEGSLDEGGPDGDDFDLEAESEELNQRILFLATVCRLWQIASRQARLALWDADEALLARCYEDVRRDVEFDEHGARVDDVAAAFARSPPSFSNAVKMRSA